MKIPGSAKQQKLLVIGTQPAVLVSLRTILSMPTVHVVATEEPEIAIRLARSAPSEIGLALIDVCTIQVEPRVLADRLREVRPGIKILFFSSLLDGEVIRLGIIDPDGGVLCKEGVVGAISDALSQPGRPAKAGRKRRLQTMSAGRSFDYPAM